ncbi:undecaprenyl diphosphate synthase [Hathewaya proteolytica DSM 3090]|uniref:Undecaprenyl diphosphate synthase n=1 Tax=Hathewaya proteolytica DSM 3090 TaxID=1121331 RepID=A0A1M6Q3A6_9CLOT|nr:undecaprenyl diphosphate synthase family protein [Hathewaya proteolytica]SHK14714.1 undecaprenyl diphosphate synthase [Hathewaya proteolytica DSM 3090]
MRIPNHVGIIPDGNRRWACDNGRAKSQGYKEGLNPGLQCLRVLRDMGVKEITYYGFTTDNTKRPKEQREAFTKACIEAVYIMQREGADVMVLGDCNSAMFPKELLPFTKRQKKEKDSLKVNLLVNYGWNWDLYSLSNKNNTNRRDIYDGIQSRDISRMDLIIRWGGRCRLSGFLPVQSVYSDFYVVEDYWPDFKPCHVEQAVMWYNNQDITLGG